LTVLMVSVSDNQGLNPYGYFIVFHTLIPIVFYHSVQNYLCRGESVIIANSVKSTDYKSAPDTGILSPNFKTLKPLNL